MSKKPEEINRKSVILSDAERRNLRRKLTGSIDTAKHVLSPRTQVNRLLERGQADVKRLSMNVSQVAQKNIATIGVIGLASLLFAGRRPISGWISRLRTRNVDAEDSAE